MDTHELMLDRAQRRKSAGSGEGRRHWLTKARPSAGSIYAALIIVLSAWVLHSFLEALLAACVTAIASWPLYRKFSACLPPRMARRAAPLVFTAGMTVFVLAPLMFALGALLAEAHALLLRSRRPTGRASRFLSGCRTFRPPGPGWLRAGRAGLRDPAPFRHGCSASTRLRC